MGSKLIALVGFILAMVLLISSEVAAARELPHTSNTADAPQATKRPITYPSRDPNKPFCNRPYYGSCIGRPFPRGYAPLPPSPYPK